MSIEARSAAGRRLLAEHVANFNGGAPVGPFERRQAIADAYRREPPDDTPTISDVREGEVGADYAWDRRPGVRAAEIRLQHDNARFHSLAVTFAVTREGE